MLPPPIVFDLNDVKQKLSLQVRPLQRSFQFWVRAIDIYTGYKVSLFLFQQLLHSFNYGFRICFIHSYFRFFNWEWISRRMFWNKKQCGKGSTSLPLIRFSLCALTLVVSSSRFFFTFWFSWTWFYFTCNFGFWFIWCPAFCFSSWFYCVSL